MLFGLLRMLFLSFSLVVLMNILISLYMKVFVFNSLSFNDFLSSFREVYCVISFVLLFLGFLIYSTLEKRNGTRN